MSQDNPFDRFVADLATSPVTLRSYRADPEAAMSAAGLSDEERALLRAGSFPAIVDYLGSGERPIPDPQPPGG